LLLKNKAVNLHRGDGAEKAVELIKNAGDVEPLCMLDGDHSYQTVRRELATISEVAPLATILIHDTFQQENGDQSGAFLAAEEFISAKTNIRQIISCNVGRPGLTLIKLSGEN